jgi:isopenicillin N synthase-like dioxygenase
MASGISSPLRSPGFDNISIPAEDTQVLDSLFEVAHTFFQRSAEDKRTFEAPTGTMTGWRQVGIEYSQDPSRPDLNETFCYRRRDDRAGVLADHALLSSCRAAQHVLHAVAAPALRRLAESLDVDPDVHEVATFQESWLQLNFSHPATAKREFIQDAHEDGHLVTVLLADQPALEILVGDQWQAVFPTSSEALVFAGECASLLTHDAVSPMMHRVRALPEVATRISVAYFVNPDLDQELEPWIRGPRNEGVDLLTWGQQNPARFGLPIL